MCPLNLNNNYIPFKLLEYKYKVTKLVNDPIPDGIVPTYRQTYINK